MEVVIFLALMVVPVIAVVALAMVIVLNRRFAALKSMQVRMVKLVDAGSSTRKILDEYEAESI